MDTDSNSATEKTLQDIIPKKEIYCGFDISTSVVGLCFIDKKSNKCELATHVDLRKFEDEYEKADFLKSELDIIFSTKHNEWKIVKIFIEEAAKKFSSGFSSAGTLMTLGRFNGIVSYDLYSRFKIKPIMINVTTARSKIGLKINYKDKTLTTKQKVLNYAMSSNPDINWIYKIDKKTQEKKYSKVNEDIADAWVLCKAGTIMF